MTINRARPLGNGTAAGHRKARQRGDRFFRKLKKKFKKGKNQGVMGCKVDTDRNGRQDPKPLLWMINETHPFRKQTSK